MPITVKFFASLRETIGISESIVDTESVVDTENGLTVAEVWSKSTNNAEFPANTLISINMDYVKTDTKVNDGDEIAFFPPVTGG